MNADKRRLIRTGLLLSACICVHLRFTSSAEAQEGPKLAKRWLSGMFYAEGANGGDFNKDGKMDIVAGPFIWDGPEFSMKREYMKPVPYDPLHYSKNFFAFPYDFDKDGWLDVMIVGFPGEDTSWYRNPGKDAKGHWERFLVTPVTGNESPVLVNLVGDEVPELVFNTDRMGYATMDPSDPKKQWVFHPIGPKGPGYQRFTHGMGVGDVNGDGRMDVLEKTGWWEQPEKLDNDPEWKKHEYEFSKQGGSQMYAYDVDGDGDNDVIASLHAHGFGLAWFENLKEGGEVTFKRHVIMNAKGEAKEGEPRFSQLHAMALVDFDGDGIKDIVTGKRYWAHGPQGDAGATEPPVMYMFKLSREGGTAKYTPVQLDDYSGVGVQLETPDLNGDGKPDIIVCNKMGTILMLQK